MTTESKTVQMKLPGFDVQVVEAIKKGRVLQKVPYQGRYRIELRKQPPRKK